MTIINRISTDKAEVNLEVERGKLIMLDKIYRSLVANTNKEME